MPTNQPRNGRQPRRGRSTESVRHPVIDNRVYPSTDEVAKILKVPAACVRQLKALAAELAKQAEVVR